MNKSNSQALIEARSSPLLLCVLFLFGLQALAQVAVITISPELIMNIREQYGSHAADRVVGWDNVMQKNQGLEIMPTLELVNKFFNRVSYRTDQQHWHKDDYWATPIEMLATNGGDCEDYSIAKYFTLRALGVPDSDMRLTYVTAIELNQAHMVLTYYGNNKANPLVLDNLIPEIKLSSERTDLKAVYSFNAENLWISRERGRGEWVGSTKEIAQWSNMLTRLPSG